MKSGVFDCLAVLAIAVSGAAPAIAGNVATPAPVVGAGLGAVVLLGAGYRVLRRKIGG